MYSTDSAQHRRNTAARQAEEQRKRALAREAVARIAAARLAVTRQVNEGARS